jgi:hypothetical protein
MLDSTAFELADFDWASRYDGRSDPPKAQSDGNDDSAAAAVAGAGCAACQRAIGDCAVQYAKAGAISPSLALSICSSIQRLAKRAFEARAATRAGYCAYVLLGPARDDASRRVDLEALAETMR